MAFAEQQRWITVQQKTFTKWLNTKLEARELEVKDLVKDLSDGVSLQSLISNLTSIGTGLMIPTGASYPSARISIKRIIGTVCRQAQATSATL